LSEKKSDVYPKYYIQRAPAREEQWN
jgi:hypothetical protein